MSNQSSLEFNLAWARAFLEWFPQAKLFPAVWGPGEDGKPTHLPGIAWGKESTSDINKIEAWARGEGLYPRIQANLGSMYFCINLRQSGLLTIDVDIKGGRKQGDQQLAALEAKYGKLPHTMTVTTPSGGLHYVYKLNGKAPAAGALPTEDGKGRLDIDLPSMTPCPGQNVPGKGYYRIHGDAITNQIPALPEWIVEYRGAQGEKSERNSDVVVEADRADIMQAAAYLATSAVVPVDGQNRNNTSFTLAAELRSRYGLNHDECLFLLESIWVPRWHGEDFLGELPKTVASAYGGNAQKGQGEDNPKNAFSAIPAAVPAGIQAYDAGCVDEKLIPKREWLLGTWFLKKFLTVTVAPGGTGKSNLSIIEGMALATGKEISGSHVHERGNVWMHNGEDPLDEIQRRVAAACKVHRIKPHELKGRFFYTSGRDCKITLVRELQRGQIYVDEAVIKSIKDFINEHAIRLWVIDPFVDMHEVSENDNGAINKVAKILSAIADETGCSIHVVHHTRKKSKDGGLTDMDMARGASALLSAARIGRNLNGMSEKDASDFILAMPCSWYVRLDSTKANLSSPTDSTEWFEKVSVELENGDGVGVLKPVELERIGVGGKDDIIRKRLLELTDERGGMISLNEAATIIANEGGVNMKRTGLIKRIKEKTLAHPYIDTGGNEYELLHANPGEREGWAVIKKGGVSPCHSG